jgi:hypothetical protein
MSNTLSVVKSLQIKHVDPEASERNFHCENRHFPSYFRGLRNFSENLAGANWPAEAESRTQTAIHFPSITAHVAIV